MKKSKRSAAVLLCGISLLIKPAYAFWPVFDFTEIVPVFQELKTTKDTIDNVQNSLTQLNETKKAIGGIGSVASFSPQLDTFNTEDVFAFSGRASQTHEETVQIASAAPQIIAEAFSSVTAAQSKSISSFVDNIRNKIFKNQPQQEIVLSYNDMLPFTLYIEEEEEEEVSEKDIKARQDELAVELNAVMTENKQLAVELNDILESLLTSLNQAAAANKTSLAELDSAVKNTNVIKDEDKDRLKMQIEALGLKQQSVTDRAAALIEDIQNSYNEEYNRIIKDGTGNYIKTAVAYLKGDEEKTAVEAAGETLKKEAASLNIVVGSESLTEIEAASQDILTETEKLKIQMQEMLKSNKG